MNPGDFRHHRTMILEVYINAHGKGTQQRVDELAAKNLNVSAVQRSIASAI